jgi:hypothetical protein
MATRLLHDMPITHETYKAIKARVAALRGYL